MNLTITPNIIPANSQSKAHHNGVVIPFFNTNYDRGGAQGNLAPLARDTVSFGSLSRAEKAAKGLMSLVSSTGNGLEANKICGDFINDCPMSIPQQMFNDTIVPMGYFEHIMNKYFSKYVANDNNPDRAIMRLDLNHKPVDSIWEKLNSIISEEKKSVEKAGGIYRFPGLDEAKKMIKDIVRGRIILRDPSKKSIKTILNVLTQMVKDGAFKVTEIENYFPVINSVPEWVQKGYQKDLGIKLDDKKLKAMKKFDFFSYPDLGDLRDFGEACRLKNSELKVDYSIDRPNGYQALHVNGELPDGTPFEIQIVGNDVCNASIREHDIYKAKCKKHVNNPVLDELFAPFRDDNEKLFQSRYANYTRWVLIGERLKEPVSFSHRKTRERYLTAPKEIRDRGLGFNQLVLAEREGKRIMREQAGKKS